MDRLISWFRVWLGVSADFTSLNARVNSLEAENRGLLRKSEELHRFSEELCKQIADLRGVLVTRKPEPKPIKAHSWSEAKRLMEESHV